MTKVSATQEITMRVARDQIINANDRLHWSGKALRTRNLRAYAKLLARSGNLKPMEAAKIEIYVSTPRSGGDVANWHPTAKAIVDGLVDYGLLPDDRDKFLRGPFLYPSGEKSQQGFYEFRVKVMPME